MKLFYIFIFSIIICIPAFAQVEQDSIQATDTVVYATPDSVVTVQELDSIVKEPQTFSFGIYSDYGKLITLWTDFERKMEFGAVLRFKNFGLGAEYGISELYPYRPFKNGDVNASGTYLGAFLQYYMAIDDKNTLYAGFGYYRATFDEEVYFIVESDLWNSYEQTYIREGVNASWAMIRIGSEQRLYKFIYLGGVFELRIKTDLDELPILDAFLIPGFGKAESSSVPAVNLYLMLKF